MAETLGTLIDRLTIVKLKQWHCEDSKKSESLQFQEEQLQEEINNFVEESLSGQIPTERLVFQSNKLYKKEQFNPEISITGNLGQVISNLAEVNCRLWHEQEKVYNFEKVPVDEKDNVINSIATLNLERNKCIEEIDLNFKQKISENL